MDFKKQKVILIVYTEDGDEIHFQLMNYKHEKVINDAISSTEDISEEFIEFCNKESLNYFMIQTYCENKWFEEYEIVKVVYIPEFGN